jgi:hypothetical protein
VLVSDLVRVERKPSNNDDQQQPQPTTGTPRPTTCSFSDQSSASSESLCPSAGVSATNSSRNSTPSPAVIALVESRQREPANQAAALREIEEREFFTHNVFFIIFHELGESLMLRISQLFAKNQSLAGRFLQCAQEFMPIPLPEYQEGSLDFTNLSSDESHALSALVEKLGNDSLNNFLRFDIKTEAEAINAKNTAESVNHLASRYRAGLVKELSMDSVDYENYRTSYMPVTIIGNASDDQNDLRYVVGGYIGDDLVKWTVSESALTDPRGPEMIRVFSFNESVEAMDEHGIWWGATIVSELDDASRTGQYAIVWKASFDGFSCITTVPRRCVRCCTNAAIGADFEILGPRKRDRAGDE